MPKPCLTEFIGGDMSDREIFGSRLGFILVSAGCAIGLGNVWKFPYMCGQFGGAAFILIYLVFLAILGFPIMVCEFSVGRNSRKSCATSFKVLEPAGTTWHRWSFFSIAGNYLLMMFYTMVAGWMLYYCFRTASGELTAPGLAVADIENKFGVMTQEPKTMIFWTFLTIAISLGICSLGLVKGVEKISKVMMLCLLVLIVVLAVHSVRLPGAEEGVRFYLLPDFKIMLDKGIGNVVFGAMSQAFFTLSIGIGSMAIFGSYLDKKSSLSGESLNIVLLDTAVALLAGLIVIPACFAYGIEPGAGPPLIFITLPRVFQEMPYGRVWGTFFFLFLSFAALSTVIAVFENIISFSRDLWGFSRKKSVLLNLVLLPLLSLPCILGFNLLANVQPMGPGSGIMDFEDFLVSNNLLPLGSLVYLLFCTSKNGWGWDAFIAEADEGKGLKFPSKIRFYMSCLLPILISVIYLKGYYDIFYPKGMSYFIPWMCFAVLLLAAVFSFPILRKKKS